MIVAPLHLSLMREPYDLPLNCPVCRRPMSVRVLLPQMFQARLIPTLKVIHCPYEGCAGELKPVLNGDIVAVSKGHHAGLTPSIPPLLDSALTAANRVFRDIDRARQFLRHAQGSSTTLRRTSAREFAETVLKIARRFE